MSKSTRILMMLAMALAVYLMVALAGGYLRDAETLRKTEAELAESRAVWEGIAEEKEALQEELKAATEDLKPGPRSSRRKTRRCGGRLPH